MSRKLVLPLALASLLSACLTQAPAPSVERPVATQAKPQAATPAVQPVQAGPGYYTVKRGDTLYRIALEHGQDYKEVAVWNNLTNPSTIKEGQVLRIAPPGADSASTGSKPVLVAPVVESRSLDKPPAQPVPVTPAQDASLKRDPKVGKEPYSDEAYARLNKGEANKSNAEVKPESKPEVKAEIKPEQVPPSGPDEIVWAMPSQGKLIAPFSESGNKGLDFAGKAGDPVLAAGDGKVVYAGSGLRGYGELVIIKHNATYLSAYAHNRKILVKEGQSVTRGQKIAEMGNSDADAVKLHFEIRKLGKPVDPAQFLPKK